MTRFSKTNHSGLVLNNVNFLRKFDRNKNNFRALDVELGLKDKRQQNIK